MDDLFEEPQLPDAQAPLGKLLDEELSAEVRKAVANLPALQREALILFEYEELSLAEIATIVGADVGAVKARLYRAREQLRRIFASRFASNPVIVPPREKYQR